MQAKFNLKYCPICKHHLSLDKFWKSSRSADGRRIYCKDCTTKKRKDNAGKLKRTEKKCPTCHIIKKIDKFRRNNMTADGRTVYCKSCLSISDRKRTYGITNEFFKSLLKQQNNCCAICGKDFDNINNKNTHIEHNHDTGKIRGICCNYCNSGIAMFKEDPEILLNAVEYLFKHNY